MTKRAYNRRSDDEIIGDLQARIETIQARIQARERRDSPVLREVPKIKRTLARFAQLCMDHDRKDISNTALAFLATLEQQARTTPESSGYAREQA